MSFRRYDLDLSPKLKFYTIIPPTVRKKFNADDAENNIFYKKNATDPEIPEKKKCLFLLEILAAHCPGYDCKLGP